jgi:hypothetical protein
MRRSVDLAQFPERRVVMQFHYTAAPQDARDWWVAFKRREIDLCLSDLGYEVDY